MQILHRSSGEPEIRLVLDLSKWRKQVHVQAQLATRVCLSAIYMCLVCNTNSGGRFILKTREQRAAEKALKDKSPLNTLTLEDWLDSERHKLTGTLTPVNEETFAKWKKERMDKKAAEFQAQQAKEATGRTLFESGNWAEEDSEAEEGEDEDGTWNLSVMRRETERLREQKEEERLLKLGGGVLPTSIPTSIPETVTPEAVG